MANRAYREFRASGERIRDVVPKSMLDAHKANFSLATV